MNYDTTMPIKLTGCLNRVKKHNVFVIEIKNQIKQVKGYLNPHTPAAMPLLNR